MRESDKNEMMYISVKVKSSGVEKIRRIGWDTYSVYLDATIIGSTFLAGYDSVSLGILSPVRGVYDEFNIVLCDFTNVRLNNLVASTLQAPLPGKFSPKIEETIKWEENDDNNMGHYQVEELTGNNVTLVYGFSDYTYYEQLTDDDFINNVSILKERMDALGNPYLIGYNGLDGRNIAIKTSPKRLGNDFVTLIGSSGDQLYIGTPDRKVSIGRSNISELIVSQGSYRNYVIYAIIDNLESIADDSITQEVFLEVGGVRVSSTYITETKEDKLLNFTSFSFISHTEMNDDNKFILDLLDVIVNGGKFSYTTDTNYVASTSMEIIDIIWDDERDIDSYFKWGVNSDSYEDARVREIMEDKFKEVEFTRARGGGNLYFSSTLEANDELPSNFMNLVKDIYESCGFDDSSYEGLYFYNENTSYPADRLRLFFRRIQGVNYNDDVPDIGKMNRFAFVTGPTFEIYADEIETLFDTMDFFIDKPRDGFYR